VYGLIKMERTLASIEVIRELNPIPDADKIEVARIKGWNVVVKTGEFKIGDKVVYCEVDSVLPERPEFEFLKDRHYRIKTVKLRGQVSQGICFPLDILPSQIDNLESGSDVTEILGVTKYEKQIPVNLCGRMRGPISRLAVPKTDEMRVQNIPDVLERHKGKTLYITEKIDGTSMSCYIDPETGLHVCSRNVDLAPDFEHKWNGNSYWTYANEYNIEEILKQMGGTIAIQGELFGKGIQGSKYKIPDIRYRVFNMWDMVNHCYLDIATMKDAVDTFGLGNDFLVPYLGEIELNHTVDDLLQLADGTSTISDVAREGLVFRPLTEETDPRLGRLSFKAVSNKFLLKHGDE
jgi:RNA ligase (TIGR02306 family)